MPRLLLINGSCVGKVGNSAALLLKAQGIIGARAEISSLDLYRNANFQKHVEQIGQSDGFIFATGTYWDSWGSPLQQFLEEATESEGSPLWLGKPAAVIVSMHAVGGKEVLSRLQGVLNTFGLSIPPMTGLVCSYANKLAIEGSEAVKTADLWRPDDLEIVCHNLLEALSGGRDWRSWPVDSEHVSEKWL